MQTVLVTKTQFARELGVGKSAVSNWIERGTISDDAIVGEGRRAKLNLELAREQVRRNRDIGQSLGNGLATRTTVDDAPQVRPASASDPSPAMLQQPSLPMAEAAPVEQTSPEAPAASSTPAAPKPDNVEDQLKRAKLEEQLRRNRIQAADEALRQGLLVSAEDAREQMTRIAGMMLQIFEGALPDFAAAIAAQFSVPQRDVLHLLRAEFKKVRKTAAMKERARAVETSKDVAASVELDA